MTADDPGLSKGKLLLPGDPGFADFQKAHANSDTDNERSSIHHTLGSTATQAAPGNHNHDKVYLPVASDTGWVAWPGAGGWTGYGTGYGGPTYRILNYGPLGRQFIFAGLLRSNSGASALFGIFPGGRTPNNIRIMIGMYNNLPCRVDVNPDGTCIISAVSGGIVVNGYFTLDNLGFWDV